GSPAPQQWRLAPSGRPARPAGAKPQRRRAGNVAGRLPAWEPPQFVCGRTIGSSRRARKAWLRPNHLTPVEADAPLLALRPARDLRKISTEREGPIFRMFPVLLAAGVALAVAPAQAEMKRDWAEYSHGDTKLKAYVAYDDSVSGKRPAVLMMHAREGMTAKTRELAEIWARLGYISFVADMFGYGQGVLPKDVPEMQAQTAIYNNDRALMRARAQAGFDALLKDPNVDATRVALIGYCFGGTVGV